MFVKQILVRDRRAFAQFVDLTRRLYAGNPAWVQPLTREVRRKLDPSTSAFYRYGTLQLLGLFNAEGNLLGRIAAIMNPLHEQLHGEAAGFFGLFECVNDPDAAQALVSAVETILRQSECTCMIGPVNLSTNDESGLLLDGYDRPPTFMCNYCHPYYHELMERCGLQKLVDTVSYETRHGHVFPEKYYRVIERVAQDSHVTLQRFDRRHATEHALQIRQVYNESFKSTYAFVPISEGEAEELAEGLLAFADLDLIWLAYYDSQPVGFILGFPDINEVLRHLNRRIGPIGLVRLLLARWTIQGCRVAAFGTLPQYRSLGIEAALIRRVHERIDTRPYHRIEFSVVMENNVRMRRLLESIGFELTRRYRLYRKELSS
ncbi:MAG: GNAT family N-acetyltransferase [candidate division Zixibacteria bacterium]|nr:GNAT family N-acetyltransferase [candidate division Zixibacteria bacterium]